MPQTKHLMGIEKTRKDFPILGIKVHGKQLIYLDNAATSQKPESVIDAVKDYYEQHNANIHRSIHKLGEEATAAYEDAHKKVSDFINADFEEVIFTKNTTESLNLAAYSLTSSLKPGDEIVISQMEHHSNFVPWQQLALKRGLKLRFIGINKDGTLDDESIKKNINKKTKIVSLVHVSNVLGTVNDAGEIGKIAHENNALFVVDGAQSVPHMPTDVKKLDCDFLTSVGICGT